MATIRSAITTAMVMATRVLAMRCQHRRQRTERFELLTLLGTPEVYVDGYYAGVVDNFDGRFQRLNLEPGPHQIEIRSGSDSRRFDVNLQPGRTMTYRADLRP